MRKVSRSALVPYTAEEMFRLVDEVEAYPDFLPWCTHAEVHERTPAEVEASLSLRKGNVEKTFRTRNRRREFESIGLSLVGGPFRDLDGGWQFRDLGGEGSKVSLDLAFEFDNRLVDMMFGAVFEDVCNSLVDAFIERAAQVYGAR